jgi:hypothetical protein
MKLGDIRKILKDISDDAEVFIICGMEEGTYFVRSVEIKKEFVCDDNGNHTEEIYREKVYLQ